MGFIELILSHLHQDLVNPFTDNSSNIYTYNSTDIYGNYIYISDNDLGTSIVDYQFSGDVGLVINNTEILLGVQLPSDIISIGNNAFNDNHLLTDVIIPSSVTSIGSYAFSVCSDIITMIIPSSVITLGEGAFYNCTGLTSFTNNSNIIIISEYLFYGCTTLTNVVIPSGVTSIGAYAFFNCYALANITIPSSVTIIDTTSFTNCTKLKTNSLPYQGTITINNPSDNIYVYNHFLPSGTNGFYLNVVMNNYSVSQIVARTGLSLGDITAVVDMLYTLPKYFGTNTTPVYNIVGTCTIDGSFGYIYTSTTSVTSVTSSSFSNGMNRLLGLFLSNNVTSIGANACQGTTNLKAIQIPNSAPSIDPTAFTGCTSLKTYSSAPYKGTLYTSNNPSDTIINFFTNITDPTSGFYLNLIILCFKEGSKILYYNSETNQEQYIEIEKLKKGDLVKTLLHGYKKIEHIGNSKMYNNVNNIRSVDKLYKCSKTEYPELFEDLIITGAHSILVNDFKDNEKEKTLELLSDIYVTDKKYRLPACIDKRAQIYEVEGQHTIWHFSLEHENYYMNYGVFANGLLVETASNRMMVECSGLNIA